MTQTVGEAEKGERQTVRLFKASWGQDSSGQSPATPLPNLPQHSQPSSLLVVLPYRPRPPDCFIFYFLQLVSASPPPFSVSSTKQSRS